MNGERALPETIDRSCLSAAFHKYGNVNAGWVTRPTTL